MQMNFAAEEIGQLAADGEAQAGAAIFPAGAGVGLLKRFENQFLLLLGNANAGIGHLEGNNGRRMVEDGMFGAPAARRRRHAEANPALRGEFERVRQQILQDLLQPFRIGEDAAPQIGVEFDVERQLPVLGFVAERSSNGVEQIG